MDISFIIFILFIFAELVISSLVVAYGEYYKSGGWIDNLNYIIVCGYVQICSKCLLLLAVILTYALCCVKHCGKCRVCAYIGLISPTFYLYFFLILDILTTIICVMICAIYTSLLFPDNCGELYCYLSIIFMVIVSLGFGKISFMCIKSKNEEQ